jgi:hypothetical protein
MKNYILINLVNEDTGEIIKVVKGDASDVKTFKKYITESFINNTGGITIRIVLMIDVSEF